MVVVAALRVRCRGEDTEEHARGDARRVRACGELEREFGNVGSAESFITRVVGGGFDGDAAAVATLSRMMNFSAAAYGKSGLVFLGALPAAVLAEDSLAITNLTV